MNACSDGEDLLVWFLVIVSNQKNDAKVCRITLVIRIDKRNCSEERYYSKSLKDFEKAISGKL